MQVDKFQSHCVYGYKFEPKLASCYPCIAGVFIFNCTGLVEVPINKSVR